MMPAFETAPPGRRVVVLAALAALGLAGCATAPHQSPPEATQPARAPASLTSRNSPTERTVEEIRLQHQNAPYPLDFEERLDHVHDGIYTWVQGTIEATDYYFAPKKDELKPVPAAPFRLGLVLESIDRSDGLDLRLTADLDIALRLPNIEDRLRVFVTSDELDESPRDSRDDNALRAGLRYEILRHVDFDIGVKVDLPPVAFASIRWRQQYALGRWDLYPLVKLFAETEEGLGYVGAVTMDRWAGNHLFRSTSFAKFRSDRDRIQWSQSLIYARADQLIVPDRYGSFVRAQDIGRGWGARLLASGGEENEGIEYYEASMFYRRPASNRWLYWFVEPLVRWDREYDWKADAGIRIGLDALFWDLARPASR
jgi:hypothetical protein